MAGEATAARAALPGQRTTVAGGGGVPIGLLTAGTGGPLLLVHGGAGQIERWGPIWDELAARWRVTAMDRRGRGSSGDAPGYRIEDEFDDVVAVVTHLAAETGAPVDVFGHSYGATCALGAAGRDGPIGRLVLYEPAGRDTITPQWLGRFTGLVHEGRAGPAVVSFLTEVIGLSDDDVDRLRRTPPAYDILAVAAATMPREGKAILDVDLASLATGVTVPTLLLEGAHSPPWAASSTRRVEEATAAEGVTLPGVGHEAIDDAPELVVEVLERFLRPR